MSTMTYLIIGLLLIHTISLVAYRLWLSPVAHIPGPFLARATYWYEFYYDVILKGQYTFKIREFHQRYGSIIRVNPHEVHIHDPDFLDEIYAGPSKPRDRWAWQTQSFGLEDVMLTAVKHNEHKRKRAPLNQYFSKSKVRALQPVIEVTIHKILARFEDYKRAARPLPLDTAMFALSNDTIMQYTFGQNYNRIAMNDFDPSFHTASTSATRGAHTVKHLPFILSLIERIPKKLLKAAAPSMAGYVVLQEDIQRQVRDAQGERSSSVQQPLQKTIYHELLENETMPLTKSFKFLWQSGVLVVLGATNTTAAVMYITIFHLLNRADCLERLRKEIASMLASMSEKSDDAPRPSLAAIENLQYLTAVIKEGLRMSGTVTTRLQRIDPVMPMVYSNRHGRRGKSYVLPPGTPVSSTVLLIHYDPEFYSNPYQFMPERWLDENGNTPVSEKYFIPFLKGTTQCLGLNLAWAEIYLLLYHMFKPGAYGSSTAHMEGDKGILELFETEEKDIEVVGDGLGPIYRPDSRGVHIRVKPCS